MLLSECLEKTVALLREREIYFAVAGGLAAGLYREEPRMTGDVDFVFTTGGNELAVAGELVKQLGFQAGYLRKAEFDGGPLFAIKNKSTPVVMVVGREKGNKQGVGTDLLLPALPWVRSGLKRAQENNVDFGFGPVPVLTVEDVILSKLYALGKSVNRPKDLDDLDSIFKAKPKLDSGYLRIQIDSIGIRILKAKQNFLPHELRKLL